MEICGNGRTMEKINRIDGATESIVKNTVDKLWKRKVGKCR